MKTILNRIAFALLIASLTSVLVFAKGKSETVNFPTDIKINGTLVKQGVYDLKFDEKTGELSIVKNGRSLLAQRRPLQSAIVKHRLWN